MKTLSEAMSLEYIFRIFLAGICGMLIKISFVYD